MVDVLALSQNRALFFAGLAFLVAAVLSRTLAPLASRIGLVDRPGGRKQHDGDIPIIGGIAMFAGYAVATLALGVGHAVVVPLVVALAVLVSAGVADDLHDLSPRSKFALQIVAALLMTSWAGVQVTQLGDLVGLGPVGLHGWSIPFTVVCVLGTVNAINMIDGLDGSAGGTSLVSALWLAYAAASQQLVLQGVLLVVLAGAIAGFLVWNLRMPWRRQAAVFMGDAGSMMLGFALCWFTVDLSQGPARTLSPMACVWILAVPLVDMARVMFVRLVRRSGIFSADREHLHHFLPARGYSVTASAWIMISASAACGAIGVLGWMNGVADWILFYAFAGLLGAILVAAYARELRMRRDNRVDG